jgi:Na+-translocating ferredoxin:NAD+ oxidoreductase RNF subunit RnfB
MNLDDDMQVAMQKLMRIEEIYDSLPKIDCGSCGSPTCHALAEDIVRGYANETDCVFKLREKISDLVEQMSEIDRNHKIKSEE